MDKLKDMLFAMIKTALNGFDSCVTGAQEILSGSGTSSFNSADVWTQVLAISNSLKPFCYSIIGICILIELAQVAAKIDMLKWEHGLKVGVKMVFAKVCIDVAPTFLRACYNQASLWITAIAGSYTPMGGGLLTEIQTQISSVTGLWSVIGLMVTCILVIMAIKVCGLLIQVIAFGRMFELYIYLAVSPLPCSFFPLGDGSGGGFSRITQKFFKNFIAVCLQGVMILVCIRIFNLIVGNAFDALLVAARAGSDPTTAINDICYTMLMGAIILVMSVTKCGSWAKGILDA